MTYAEATKRAEGGTPYYSHDFYYHCPNCDSRINYQDKFCAICGEWFAWNTEIKEELNMLNIDKVLKKLHSLTADDLCTEAYEQVLYDAAFLVGFCCDVCPYHRDTPQYRDVNGIAHNCRLGARCVDGAKAWVFSSDDGRELRYREAEERSREESIFNFVKNYGKEETK